MKVLASSLFYSCVCVRLCVCVCVCVCHLSMTKDKSGEDHLAQNKQGQNMTRFMVESGEFLHYSCNHTAE